MRHARARERAGERESEREREGRRERPAFSSISMPDMPLVKGGGWSKAIFSTASRMPFLTPSDSARVRAVAGTGSSSSSSKDLKRPFCPSRNASSSSAMSSGCAPRQCQTRPGSAAKELCAQHKRDLTEQKRPTWRGELLGGGRGPPCVMACQHGGRGRIPADSRGRCKAGGRRGGSCCASTAPSS